MINKNSTTEVDAWSPFVSFQLKCTSWSPFHIRWKSFVLTKALCALLFGPNSIVKLSESLNACGLLKATCHVPFLTGLFTQKRALPSQAWWPTPVSNSRTWKAEARGLQGVPGQPGFKMSLCLQKQRNRDPQQTNKQTLNPAKETKPKPKKKGRKRAKTNFHCLY